MNELDQAFIRAYSKRPATHKVIQQLRSEEPARTFRIELGTVATGATQAYVDPPMERPATTPQPIVPQPVTTPPTGDVAQKIEPVAVHSGHSLPRPHRPTARPQPTSSQQPAPTETPVNSTTNASILVMSNAQATPSVIDCNDVVGVYDVNEEVEVPPQSTPQVEAPAAPTPPIKVDDEDTSAYDLAPVDPVEPPQVVEPVSEEAAPVEPPHVYHPPPSARPPRADSRPKSPAPLETESEPQPLPKPLPIKRLQPAWEVDQFEWPSVCNQLVEQQWLKGVGKQLGNANRDGLKIMAVTGLHAAEGRTTLALCLARTASQAGLRVALIDADFRNPGLSERLCVAAPNSWLDALQSGSPFEETAILSTADDITLFPLTRSAAKNLGGHLKQVANWLNTLANSFDLLIVDAGAQSSSSHQFIAVNTAEAIDAVTIVRDMRRTTESDLDAAIRRIQLAGIDAVGVIENFGNRQAEADQATA